MALAGVAAVLIPPKEDVIADSVSLLERGDRGERGEYEGARPDAGVSGEFACEADSAA